MTLDDLSRLYSQPLTIQTELRGMNWYAYIRCGRAIVFRGEDYSSEQGAIDNAIAGLAKEKGLG